MNPWYFAIYHLTRLVARVFFRFRVVHPERVIQEGPVILAMNHESYLDPPFAGIGCRRAMYFLARKSLLEVPVLGWLLPKLNVIPSTRKAAIAALSRRSSAFSRKPGRARFSRGRAHARRQSSAAPERHRVCHRENPRAGRADANFRRAHQALPRGGGRLRLSSDHHRRRRAAIASPRPTSKERPRGLPRLSQRVMDSIAALRL